MVQMFAPPITFFILANLSTGHRDFAVLAVGHHAK